MTRFKIIINTIYMTVAKARHAFGKAWPARLIFNKKAKPTQSRAFDAHGISKAEASVILLSSVAMSQMQKAILAAGNINYQPNNEQPCGSDRLNNSNVSVNAGPIPLSAGMLMMLDICAKNTQPLSIENRP